MQIDLPFRPKPPFHSTSMRSAFPALALAASLCLTAAGCRDREITTYRAPKEKAAPPPAAAAPDAAGTMAKTAVPTADGAGLTWTAPTHWQPKAASAMRKGSYTVPAGAAAGDLAITAFPGDVGGEVANLNRWRGQLQLPPASEADLALTRFEQDGLKIAVIDFDNGQQRLLGAIVPLRGSTWFFKLTGPAAPMAEEKPAFLAFLKTIKAPAP
jgi:hypothetical protein